jgi:hypothetical protein
VSSAVSGAFDIPCLTFDIPILLLAKGKGKPYQQYRYCLMITQYLYRSYTVDRALVYRSYNEEWVKGSDII